MSKILPLFTSAPRLKLRIDDVVVAYAIGFDVSASINISTVKGIGYFGPMSLEPTMANVVTGTMQIVRLVSASKLADQNAALKTSSLVAADPTALTANQSASGIEGQGLSQEVVTNSISSIKGLHAHLDPTKVLASTSFNVDVYFRLPSSTLAPTQTAAGKTVYNGMGPEAPWIRIQNCRLTGRNTNISLGALVNEPVNFMGTLLTPMNGNLPVFSHDSSLSEQVGF